MQTNLLASQEMAACYLEIFVNRRAYTLQSLTPHRENGKHYYYRPRRPISLSTATIRRHLQGEITDWAICNQSRDATLQVGGDRC